MVDPFKKYNLDRAEFETPERLQGVSALKQHVISERKRHTAEELLNYSNVDEFREANDGYVPPDVAQFYDELKFRSFAQGQDAVGIKRRAYERDAVVSNADAATAGGTVINALAGAAGTVNRWGRDAAVAGDTAAINSLLNGVPEDILEIWQAKEKGERELTPEEEKRLNSKETRSLGDHAISAIKNQMNPLKMASDTAITGLSFRERLERADEHLARAKETSDWFMNNPVAKARNQINNEELVGDLSDSYDDNQHFIAQVDQDVKAGNFGSAVANTMMGVGNLIKDGAGDLLSNPEATFEFVAEQAPYLALGAYSKTILAGVNISYGTNIYREKLEAYQEEHGRPPSQEDRAALLGWSLTASAAEQIGDLSMLKALKGTKKFSKAVTKVLEITPDSIQKTANNVFVRNTLSVAKTAATEGMTEIYQTAVEESEKNPFDGTVGGKALFTAGILGAAAGGGFASVGSTGDVLSSVTGAALKKMKDKAQDRATLRTNKALVNEYVKEIKAGERDIDSLLDDSDPRTYDPAKAAGLHILGAMDENATPEDKQASKQKAGQIMDMLSQRVIEQRAELDAEKNKTERKKISKSLRETQEFLRRTNDAHAYMARSEEIQQEMEEDLKTATQEEVTEDSQAATGRVIRSMTMNSDLYGEETILSDLEKLKASPSISAEQREHINGIIASFTAQQALNNANKSPDQVANSIMNGAVGFKGIREYRRDVNRALKEDDVGRATTEVDNLRSFAREHSAKLKAAKAARELAVTEGKNTYIYKDPNSDQGWQHGIIDNVEGLPWKTRREQSQLGGFAFVRQRKGGFSGEAHIANLEAEVGLINAMGIELSQAVNLTQGSEVIARASAETATDTATDSDAKAFGFDPSLVPQVTDSAPAGSGNVNTADDASTTPEPAQPVAEAAPEQTTPASAADIRPQAVAAAQNIGLSDPEGFVDQLIEQETSNEAVSRSRASDRVHEYVREARDQGITFNQLSEVSDLVAQLSQTDNTDQQSQTERNQEQTSGDSLTEQGAISDQDINEMPPQEQDNDFADPRDLQTETESTPVSQPASTTTQAQAAPAAQEPDVVVDAQTEQNQEQEVLAEETEASNLFKQREANKDTITVNPLATKQNFFSKLFDSGEEFISVMQRYIEKPINEKQAILLNQFAGFAKRLDKTLQDITGPKRNERFEHEDLVKTFGEFVPENIRAGVIASIFSVIGEDGWKTRNLDSDINAILNRDLNTRPSGPERAFLGEEPIVRQNVFGRKLGKRVIQFLNIQGLQDQPVDKIRNLEAALGAYAIGLMLEEGLLLKQEEDNPILNQNNSRERVTHNLVMINIHDPTVQQIVANTRGTASVLTRLFGTEQMSSEPASKPGSFVAAKQNSDLAQLEQSQNTSQLETSDNTPVLKKNIPAVLARVLEIVSGRPQTLNRDVGDKLLQFGGEGVGREQAMARLAGLRTEEQGMIHEANAESVEAANDGIIRDIQSWLDFRESNQDAPFYLRPVVWLQQRVGLDHTVMNPQSSKVHRHLMYPKSWEIELDPSADTQENMLFKVAIAQGMGFPVDKKNLQAAVERFEELTRDPVMQAGMTAILKDQLDDADREAILAAVKQGGENLWSFHVLLEMAKYSQGQTFTTNVMVEIDGVTNGPALTNLMLGTIGPWLGSKVGLIQRDVASTYGINNHSQFKEGGGRDMYESLAHLVQKELNEAMNEPASYQAIQDILYFTGSFSDTSGRKRVKTPLTSLKFGSGLGGTIDNMADEFIGLYYEAIEKSADDSDFITQQEILTRINRLLPRNNQVQSITEVLNRRQQAAIQRHFTEHVGTAVETALETQFASFMERRTEIYGASKALFEVYEKARDFLISQAVEKAIKNGDIRVVEVDGKEQAIDDLSQRAYDEIDRKLGDMLPVIHTALSKLSNGTDRTKGLMLAKQVKQEAEGSNVYRQKVQFSRPLQNNFTKSKNGTKKISNWVRVRAEKLSWEEPGVRAVVLGIHATDSAIASLTYKDFNGLNVHDAIGFRLKDVLMGGRALNRNTFRVMTEYSLPLELLNSLQDSHDALQTMLAELPADQRAQLQSAINSINLGTEKKPIRYGQGVINSFAGIAYRMEVDKLTFMAELDKISQYSLDGTEYTVTNKDRQIVNDRLTDAQGRLAQYGGHLAHREIMTEQEQTPTQTRWGQVGPARHNSDPELVDLFGDSGKITARDLARNLKARISAGGRTPELIQFETRLLNAVMKIVDPDLEIRLIRPDSPAIEGMEDLQDSSGFYHPDGWIGVKGPEFRDSLITTEMLLHELVHAATENTLYRVENGQETNPVAVQAHKRLQQLLTKAQAYVQKEGLTDQFGPAVSNVSELVSWGLTNAKFQEQVLAKVQMDAESQQGLATESRQSGFLAFIKSLAGLLFKNRNNQFFETGLGSLVANSAILIEHAGNPGSQGQPQADGNRPIRSMQVGQNAFNMSPQEVFDALASKDAPATPERSRYLRNILTEVTDKVFQDGAFKERVQRETPFTAQDVFLEATQGSEAAFTSDLANTLDLSQQEQYVLESLELAMRNTLQLNTARPVVREAEAMWQTMKEQGKQVMYPGDWNSLRKDQQDYYEAAYNAIFKVKLNKDNRSLYLSKFMAAAVVYQPLAHAMSAQTVQRGDASLHGLTFKQRIDKLLKLALSMLSRWFSKARDGDSYSETAGRLVYQMVHLERKRQRRVERARKRGETGIEAKVNKLTEGIKQGFSKAAQSEPFQNSKNKFVRMSSTAVELSMEGRVGAFMDNLKKLRDGATGEKTGFWGQTWTELRGDDNVLAQLTQLLSDTKTLEQKRKRFNIEVANDILAAFEGKLTKEESEALTKILVRSGAHILLGPHSMTGILDLIADDQVRQARIQALIDQLPVDHRGYYASQARALGIHMASGHVKTPLLMRNAYNIVHKLGTSERFKVDAQVAAAAEPLVDELATLIAIDQQGAASSQESGNYRDLTAEVMRRELGRSTENQNLNGAEFLLRSHREMEREAHNSLFDGDKTQIVKGYTKDTYDPYIDVVVAGRSEWDKLKKAGYTRVEHELMRDDADPRGEDYALFTIRNGGLGQHVTAIFNNTDGQRQGSNVAEGINAKSQKILQDIANNKRGAVRGMMDGQGPGQGNNALVPVLNTKGDVIGWRYLMSEVTRDSVLGRKNDVGKVMGNIASSIIDKAQTPQVNKNAVDALKNIYEDDFLDNSEAYIEFGPNSTDPEIRERYKLLPETTKKYIRDVWGRDGMMIRNDSYNILFGYRKVSIGSVLSIEPEVRTALQRILVHAIGEVELRDENGKLVKRLAAKRGTRLLQAENVWQELVTAIKDILVIKSGVTLMGNESSNLTVLYLNGVPISDIVKLKALAYTSTKEYIGQRREKEALERSIRLGHLQGQYLQEAHERVIVLNERMTANPVSELMDDGMYQTLVEDVSQDDDPYSYQSLLSEKLEKTTRWVPKPVKTVGKTLLMTHDSGLYKVMNDLTVMSDFTSRYVLNEHLKNRVNNEMTVEDRRQRVRDAFVDYDVPTSKAMQYMNDMGVVWFSKYYMRIQHVILQQVKENPARALQIWAMADWLYSLPDILDSTWMSKDLGNMLGTGAFQIMDAPQEIMTYSGTVG